MTWFTQEYLSESEKTDRIYRMLRSQQRSRYIGLSMRLVIIGGIFYGYHYLGLPENAHVREKMLQSFQSQISNIVTPMVESMVGDMTARLTNEGVSSGTGARHRNIPSGSSALPAGVTPEMVRAVQESMNKK